jgi:hypothetical protein
MLAEALQAEVDAYIARFGGEHDERGRRLVVRNGSHQPREVLTAAGAVEVRPPRANDRRTDHDTGERARICSAILPPWVRKTPKICTQQGTPINAACASSAAVCPRCSVSSIDPISDGEARTTIGRVELPPAGHYDAHLKLA